MKRIMGLKRISHMVAVIVIILGVIPFAVAANTTTVYADGEETTEPVETPTEEQETEEAESVVSAEEELADTTVSEESPETPEETAAEETVPDGQAENEISEEPAEEINENAEVVEEAAQVEESQAVEAEPAEQEIAEDLSELVEVLSEEEVQIVDENGEPLTFASEETAELLSNTDPFFWNGTEWIGFTETGDGCPANVTCFASLTPFQDAVTQAGAGNTIFVADGNYDEDVVIGAGSENLTLTAFHDIEVEAGSNVVSMYTSGYAVVNQITLNVDLTATNGVYADYVIVNEPGETEGRLDDAMELVNDGGRIEATIKIKSGGGHYRAHDYYHQETYFEWECGEPDKYIYPSRVYRMILKNPYDEDVLKYYDDRTDERTGAPYYLDLSAVERMDDLIIGVNVSEEGATTPNWTHKDEERIYWYLLGDIGKSRTTAQQNMANEITGGDWEDITRFWNIWFLWPKEENGNDNVSPDNRQLTFFVYDPQPVYGCMDPEAENYDPNADTDNELCEYNYGCMDPEALNYDPDATRPDQSCRYESNTESPPVFAPNPLPIPVTGEEELLLIPVTGASGLDANFNLFEITLIMSIMIIGACIYYFFVKKQKTN
ncbi:MAG: hypothetical protein J7L66_00710 [Anaerolineaceae bacterium]|nr:hypothetical protein [Anaerolineaceae bacterium]